MSINIGTAVLEMAANTARLNTDLGKALGHIEKFQRSANRFLGTIGIGLSAVGFIAFVKGAIDSADRLKDLGARTGLTGQQLIVLEGAAVRSGVGLETISEVASKLSGRLSDAAKGTGDVAEAFKKMGLSATDSSGRIKNIDQIMKEVGAKFKTYEDGANKAALATAVFGKGGDRMIPVVEAIEETQKRFEELGITISQETLNAADAFNDKMSDLGSVTRAGGMVIAEALLPYLVQAADALITFSNNAGTLKSVIDAVIFPLKVMATGFITLMTAVASAADIVFGFSTALGLLSSGSPLKAIDELSMAFKRAADRNKGLTETVSAFWAASEPSKVAGAVNVPRRQAPGLPNTAGNTKLLAEAKANNEALIRLTEQRAKTELSVLKTANDMRQRALDRSYQDNQISNVDYWTQRLALARMSLDAELAVLDKQAKRQQAIVDEIVKREAAGKIKKGSAEYSNALGDLEQTMAEVNERHAEFKEFAVNNYVGAKNATRDYKDEVERLRIKLMELQGNTAGAAKAGLDLQNRDWRAKFQGDEGALSLLDNVEKLEQGQIDFNKVLNDTSRIMDSLAIKEGLIQGAHKVGSISDIEAMIRLGAARKEIVRQLENQYDALQKISQLDPNNQKYIQELEQLRTKIGEVAAESNLLADKLGTMFKDAFAEGFTDVIMGAKSAGDAFRDFAQSVISQMAKMAAQAFATDLFNMVKAVGGTAKGGEKPAGGGGILGTVVGIVGKVLGFASGTNYVPRDMLAMVHKGEAIIPAGVNQGGSVTNMTINYNPSGNGGAADAQELLAILTPAVRGMIRGELTTQLRPGGVLT